MVLIEDTRQQAGKHRNIDAYCKRHGIELVRKKLDVGDYMVEGTAIAIDTKADMQEVYSNLIHDHDRFRRECMRAKENGIKLIVLVEEAGITTLEDVKNWKNPRVEQYEWAVAHGYKGAKAPPISSKRLYGIMRTMEENYGIQFQFCHKRSTGKRIMEILSNDGLHDNGNDSAERIGPGSGESVGIES